MQPRLRSFQALCMPVSTVPDLKPASDPPPAFTILQFNAAPPLQCVYVLDGSAFNLQVTGML